MWGPMEDLGPAAHRDHLSVDRALAALPDLLRVLNTFLKWLLGFIITGFISVGGSVRSFHLGRASRSGSIFFRTSE